MRIAPGVEKKPSIRQKLANIIEKLANRIRYAKQTQQNEKNTTGESGVVYTKDDTDNNKAADKSGVKLQGQQNIISLSSDKDIVQKNIDSGNTAVKSLIEQVKTSDNSEELVFENAMYRSDIGQIDFRWGTAGKGAKFKHGYGLAHIIAKRNSENSNGEAIAYKMVEVIAKATEGIQQGNNQVSQDDARIKLYYDGYTAVLVKSNDAKKWLLTGWENEETATSATGEVRDSSSATAVTPIRTRRNGDVTVSNNIISDLSEKNNPSTENNSNNPHAKDDTALSDGSDILSVEVLIFLSIYDILLINPNCFPFNGTEIPQTWNQRRVFFLSSFK